MTERAKRAAAVLGALGWTIDTISKTCLVCGEDCMPEHRFCSTCGNRLVSTYDPAGIADLEAAIAAAVDSGKKRG